MVQRLICNLIYFYKPKFVFWGIEIQIFPRWENSKVEDNYWNMETNRLILLNIADAILRPKILSLMWMGE